MCESCHSPLSPPGSPCPESTELRTEKSSPSSLISSGQGRQPGVEITVTFFPLSSFKQQNLEQRQATTWSTSSGAFSTSQVTVAVPSHLPWGLVTRRVGWGSGQSPDGEA